MAPDPIPAVEVTATDASSVTIAWPPSSRDDRVVGYAIYVNGARVGLETPDHVKRWRDKDALSYTVDKLTCGTGYSIGVDAFDRSDNHSTITSTTVSTSACPDATAPSPPSDVRQIAATENSVAFSWSPSSDNVGVVEYGLYASGVRVATASDATATLSDLSCGTSYLVAIDAADAAGNRSTRTSSYLRTSTCPTANQPPSTPTALKVSAATQTSVTLAWTASKDDVAVAGYGLYVGGKRTADTTQPSATFASLQCGTTYALGVDAFDAAGKRSTVAELSTATSPCVSTPPPTTTATLAQTIPSGATLSGSVSWRAVYDGNGDKVPDDPGSVRFLVDGKVMLTEQTMPFGDTAGFFASTSVANGPHTFLVQAVSDTGTVMASNTTTASVANTTESTPPPPPPTGDTTAPSSPGNVRVTSASASSVTVAWSASTDNTAVAGYGVYRGSTQTGQIQQTTTTYSGLSCGTGYQVGVDAYDAAGNRSARVDIAVTTSPCADDQAPTAPANVTASSRTTTSIALTWAPATDNIGVAGYGVYNGADLVSTTAGTTGIVGGLVCGTNYTLAVDAFDGSGNSSPKSTVMVATLDCPAPVDTTAPTASVTAPANGSTVTGT